MSSVDSLINTGQPEELYLFNSDVRTWAYTNGKKSVSFGGHTYEPEFITRTGIIDSEDPFTGSGTIYLPRDNEFAFEFQKYGFDFPVSISIFRGDRALADYSLYRKGRAVTPRGGGPEIGIDWVNFFSTMSSPGLTSRLLKTCGHSVFQHGCNLNRESFAVTDTVIGVSGTQVTFSGLVQADQWFLGGVLKGINNVERWIVNHVGQVITLERPLSGLEAGQVITLYPGCDRTMNTCNSKFNNKLNFKGRNFLNDYHLFDGRSFV